MEGKRSNADEDRGDTKRQRENETKSVGGESALGSVPAAGAVAGAEEPVGPLWAPLRKNLEPLKCIAKRLGDNSSEGEPSKRGSSSAALEEAYLRAIYEDDWEWRLRREEDEDWYPIYKKYEEYCAIADADPSFQGYKLDYEEFQGQRMITEEEFGPEDTLDSIWEEAMDLPWPKKIQMREWRLRANRFLEVNRRKRERDTSETHPNSPYHKEDVVSLGDNVDAGSMENDPRMHRY